MRKCACIPVIGSILLGGCANWNSIYRELDLGSGDSSPRAVAIDAKQRAIISSPRTSIEGEVTTKTNVVCPEASPDALSATTISAALSGTLDRPAGTSPTDAQLKAAAAIAEGAASIGLRTQSIQLMRDGLVYNCLMFMNGAVTPNQAYRLQRRSQNFTLGLLAIEQLTGPVKAAQAALTAQGASSTGQTDVSAEAASLKAAEDKYASDKAALAQGRVELKELQEEETKQREKVAKADKDHQAAAAAAKKDPKDETKAAAAAKLEELNTEKTALTGKTKEVNDKKIAVETLHLAEKSSAKQVAVADDALQQARSRVRASTNATAVLAASGQSSVLITKPIADAVVNIVQSVLKESASGEECAFLAAWLLDDRDPSPQTAALVDAFRAGCKVEAATIEKNPTYQANVNKTQVFRGVANVPPGPIQ